MISSLSLNTLVLTSQQAFDYSDPLEDFTTSSLIAWTRDLPVSQAKQTKVVYLSRFRSGEGVTLPKLPCFKCGYHVPNIHDIFYNVEAHTIEPHINVIDQVSGSHICSTCLAKSPADAFMLFRYLLEMDSCVSDSTVENTPEYYRSFEYVSVIKQLFYIFSDMNLGSGDTTIPDLSSEDQVLRLINIAKSEQAFDEAFKYTIQLFNEYDNKVKVHDFSL